MMKQLYTLISMIALGLFLVSCTDKKISALKELESFTEEIKYSSDHYTQDEWDNAQNEFCIICEELDNYDYTDEELNYIGRMKGECTALFARHTVSDLKKSLNRIGQEVKGFVEGFTEEVENENVNDE